MYNILLTKLLYDQMLKEGKLKFPKSTNKIDSSSGFLTECFYAEFFLSTPLDRGFNRSIVQ